MASRPIVLDTNIVLDLFVFRDEAAQPLRQALESNRFQWLTTAAMRGELERVLAYPQIQQQLSLRSLTTDGILAAFDHHSRRVDAPAKAPVTCSDGDDQKFIDLAVAQAATLLSKDQAVLSMKKRLAGLGVEVAVRFDVALAASLRS